MFPNMTHMLDKLVVKSLMPCEYEYLLHVLLNSCSSASSSFFSHCENKSIIKSVNRGTSCPGTWTSPCPNNKTNGQWTISALLLFTNGLAFYYQVHHWMFNVICRKFPPWMMHGLDWRPGRLSSQLFPLLKLASFHIYFDMIGIHRQKYMISTNF